MTHFTENTYGDLEAATSEFWDSCREEMMVNMHKRLRECGDGKLKFQVGVTDNVCIAKSSIVTSSCQVKGYILVSFMYSLVDMDIASKIVS